MATDDRWFVEAVLWAGRTGCPGAVMLTVVFAQDGPMKPKLLYHGHRFPAAIISQAVRWYFRWYFRFQPSLRDIEEL